MTPDYHPSSASYVDSDNAYANISYYFKQQQRGYSSGMDGSGNNSKETEGNGAADADYMPETRNATLCRYSSC